MKSSGAEKLSDMYSDLRCGGFFIVRFAIGRFRLRVGLYR